MYIPEKLEECPACGERKFWFYDGQMCANCGHGEPKPTQNQAFHSERMEAWLKELWSAQSIDLHMCDGTVREDQFGTLRDIREDVMAARRELTDTKAVMAKLLISAKILLANAHDCTVNHHSHRDEEPGWLADCLRDVEEAANQFTD